MKSSASRWALPNDMCCGKRPGQPTEAPLQVILILKGGKSPVRPFIFSQGREVAGGINASISYLTLNKVSIYSVLG